MRTDYEPDPIHEYRRFACRSCGFIINAPVSCGNRFCSVCASTRRRKIIAKMNRAIKGVQDTHSTRFKMVTLTIPNVEKLGSGSKTLILSFRKLRQRCFWNNLVKGGFYILEVAGCAGKWHIHLHILCHSRYIPVRKLSKIWAKVSPGKIVYVQNISPSVAVKYMSKYVTKSVLTVPQQRIASAELENVRLFQAFGSFHKLLLQTPRVAYCCPKCNYDQWLPMYDIGYQYYKKYSSPG
jgi:hypothetical protein